MSSTTQSSDDVLKTFNPNKIILPIMLTLGVLILLMLRDFKVATLWSIDWAWTTALCLLMGFVLIAIRHLALMFRLKVLTEHKLSWKQSFQVISLWEFGSAVTPTTVGGTAIAYFLLTREKINAGETISVVLFTILLDGIYFLVGIPILWLLLGNALIIPAQELGVTGGGASVTIITAFLMAYAFMALYTLAIAYGLIINPRSFKWFLIRLTSFKWTARWRPNAIETGNDMITASERLKKKGWNYWLAGLGATGVHWISRFLILNFVMLAFITVGGHLLLFGRQMIIYLLMVVAITPGGSGIAELVSDNLLDDFFIGAGGDSMKAVVIAVWRVVSYVTYLVIGMIVMPTWLRRVLKRHPSTSKL